MRRWAVLGASLVVSGLFLWLALRDVPLAEVWERIRQAQLGWVLASGGTIALAIAVRAVRWRGLLGFKIPLGRAFYILCVTFLLNQLPLRAGEIARSLLATRSGIPVVTAATSILVERLLDTLFVVVLLAAGLSRLPDAPETATRAATLFGVAAVLAFAALMVFVRYPRLAHRVLDTLERAVPPLRRLRLGRLVDHVLDGLRPLTDLRHAAHAVGWTVVSWLVSLTTFYALELALGIADVDLLLTAVLGVTLASFSIAIPVSVAAIGPFELAVKVAGAAVGMADGTATSLGFLFHGVTILAYALLGTVSLLALGVSLGEVMRAAESPPAAPRPALERADDV